MMLAAGTAIAGCSAAPPAIEALAECRLPGQLRKLGQHFVYSTPSQSVMIAAVECRLRGGEVVPLEAEVHGPRAAVHSN